MQKKDVLILAKVRAEAAALRAVQAAVEEPAEGCACDSRGPCAWHAGHWQEVQFAIERLEGIARALERGPNAPNPE